MIFQGKNAEAEALVNQYFVCKGEGAGQGKSTDLPYGSYQVLGNLHLQYQYGKDPALIHPGIMSVDYKNSYGYRCRTLDHIDT